MKQQGLTLVELLVSAAIGLVVMASVLAMITDFMRSQNNAKKVEDLLVTSETAFNMVTQDARWADDFYPTSSPVGFRLVRKIDDKTEKYINYKLVNTDPKQPDHFNMIRVDESGVEILINKPSVVILGSGFKVVDSNIEKFGPEFYNKHGGAKLMELKLTLLHTNPQGARTVHESSTKISLRNTEINF